LVIVDTAYPVGHSVFTCDYQGTEIVGHMFTMGLSDIFCNVVVSSFWEPLEAVDSLTCTLGQVLNSYRCPNGSAASCQDVDCTTACGRSGYQGGRCPSNGGDGCECW
jgi:hypothetical protein